MIEGFSRKNRVDEAKALLDEMTKNKIRPRPEIYNSIIISCARLKDHSLTEKLFSSMRSKRINPTIETWNAVILCFAKYFETLK